MLKKTLFLILPLVFLLFTVSPLVYAEKELIVDGDSSEWSDDRIGINVNQVYVSEVIPVDVEALFDDIPALTEGYDYVIINLTVVSIENVHLVMLGYENEDCVLYTDENYSYTVKIIHVQGLQFQDPTDITSPYEIVENATLIMLFEVPKNEIPEGMELIYSYKNSLEETSENRGQINIEIAEEDIIPEFPVFVVLLLSLTAGTLVVILVKRKTIGKSARANTVKEQ